MLKLVVLSVLVAVVAAAPHPGYLQSAPLVYGYPVATSHSSRVDYHSKPILTTYAAHPLISSHQLVSPVIKDYGYGSIYGGYGNYGYGSHGYGGYGNHGYGYGW